jgi:ADP-heptose:LPS heptosyltransferase
VLDALPAELNRTVIGTVNDDYSWWPGPRVVGKSLSYIAGLLSKCKLFISIDSGPANLATLLGIKNHVLLYPHNCQITANPYATKVRVSKEWPLVKDIPVQPVIDACTKLLEE